MDPLITNNKLSPDFTLLDLDGKPHTLSDLIGGVVILNFWSAECPHAARTDQELGKYLKIWGAQVTLLPIAANASEPFERLREVADRRSLNPVLHDVQQQVADLYGAVTTPHLYVIDPAGILRYQGAFDDVTFRQRTPTLLYLQNAVQTVLEGKNPEPSQTMPYGCAIVRYAV